MCINCFIEEGDLEIPARGDFSEDYFGEEYSQEENNKQSNKESRNAESI